MLIDHTNGRVLDLLETREKAAVVAWLAGCSSEKSPPRADAAALQKEADAHRAMHDRQAKNE